MPPSRFFERKIKIGRGRTPALILELDAQATIGMWHRQGNGKLKHGANDFDKRMFNMAMRFSAPLPFEGEMRTHDAAVNFQIVCNYFIRV